MIRWGDELFTAGYEHRETYDDLRFLYTGPINPTPNAEAAPAGITSVPVEDATGL